MSFTHLGPYSDLVEAARLSRSASAPGNEIERLLEFNPWKPEFRDAKIEQSWKKDRILAEEISWSCGYGPRTHAWLFYPAEAPQHPRPGIVLLHDHGAFKYWGKEKVADGPNGPEPGIPEMRHHSYGDRAVAEALARAGFTVLVPDCFLWGSRRLPYKTIPEGDRHLGKLIFEELLYGDNEGWKALPEEVRLYNTASQINEHTMAKYLTILGTNFAGIVNFEDRIAAQYLLSRTDVCSGWIGCAGLSGGGIRSALLRATCDPIRAAVVVGMMTTYAGLLDRQLILHTWMLYPPALARRYDWPDVAAQRPQVPLLVQYDRDDPLFNIEGMKAADAHLRSAFTGAGKPGNYVGQFYPGPHQFDSTMQDAAIAWLLKQSGMI